MEISEFYDFEDMRETRHLLVAGLPENIKEDKYGDLNAASI